MPPLNGETNGDRGADDATRIAIARELCRTSRELRAASRVLLRELAAVYSAQAVIGEDNAARANGSPAATIMRARADRARQQARRLQALADR